MKPRLTLSFLALVAFCGPSRADFRANFSAPPYVRDETVLGIDGWENRLPTDKDTRGTARVEAVPWGDGSPALVLRGASLKNLFTPVAGGRTAITFSLAIQATGKVLPGRQFRIFFGGAPTGEVYYMPGPEGGFGYAGEGDGRSGGIICVPQSDILENSFYTFTLEIDMDQQTYHIAVTGEKADGSPLTFKVENVAFLSPGKPNPKVDGVYILSGQRLDVYLGSVAVELK